MMKKLFFALTVLILACTLLPSCKMRPRDAERLKAEATAGNLKSMEMLAVYGDTLVSRNERNQYLDVLVKNGNFRALSARYSEEYNRSGKLSEKQWQAMYMRWMEKGARMGTPDCMYRLGKMYLEKEHPDSTKAMYWLGQAADSLQASASVELRIITGKQTVLDRPRFAFRQMWGYSARDKSFLNRASNASFHFMSECLRSSFRNLFSSRWWQSLLMMVFMFLVLATGVIYGLGRNGPEAVSVSVSSLYGLLNGMALFVFAKGKSTIPGILVSFDAIGQFTRQPATYGLVSDLCIWGTWLWVIIIALMYLIGLFRQIRQGQLTTWSFLAYTFRILFVSIFFYLLAGAVSAFSRFFGIILAAVLLFSSGGEVREFTEEEKKKMRYELEEAKRREQERIRKQEDEQRWQRQQEEWQRQKNR